MSFLQPLLLIGLPLAGLPILIHLINQRRFQNIDWGAMRFLLEANRMSRGYARIRQWLILLFRTLAVGALVFTAARPLASGRLGLLGGGRAETTIVLLDRSASMMQRGPANVAAKLETGVGQLAQVLETLGPSRWVLIDSVSLVPQEIESPRSLLNSASATATSASADLPALLQAAHDYIRANRTGQTEIWICSDLRASDWNAASGQWATLRDAFRELPQGVRFHLLAYPEEAVDNVAIRLTDVRRQHASDGASLLVSFALSTGAAKETQSIPVQIEIEGARSEIVVELTGGEATIQDHPAPIEADRQRGWGRISIPADGNPADNEFYFVFAEPPRRRTLLVGDDEEALRPLQLAASILPAEPANADAELVDPVQRGAIDWSDVALVVWNAPLPTGSDARQLQSLVERGGQAVFLPPRNPAGAELFGVSWGEWREPAEPVAVETWRSDQDLLVRTRSGEALPVGELKIRRYCTLQGLATPLATLYGGDALLVRATTPAGGAYFLATTAEVSDSSLATNGIVLYAAIQRALEAGAESLATARQLVAGPASATDAAWQQLAGAPEALSTEYSYHSGAYAAGDRLLAVNRSEQEDRPAVLDDQRVEELFAGLDFDRVDDRAGNLNSLAREVWRLFLVGMAGALIVEAGLCLPKRPSLTGTAA